MPASYGKKDKAKATRLHSVYVRTRDNHTCRWCGLGKTDGKQVQCAHILSRSISSTRTDENNAVTLCAACHWKQTKNPLIWARWIENELGNELIESLINRSVPGIKVDWSSEVKRLEGLIGQLNATLVDYDYE